MEKSTIKDIENVSFDILKQSKSLGVFPTPVDKIVSYCELNLDKKSYLNNIPTNYISKSSAALMSALRKVRGALDRRQNTVYVDLSLPPNKQRFVKLHEVGHKALPWQSRTDEFIDFDETLSAETSVEFEFEANFFASATLFQLDRFDEEANGLALGIESPMLLAKKFGGSIHAAMRRFVEKNKKRCALLIIEDQTGQLPRLKVKGYFQSSSFTHEFGMLKWSETIDASYTFTADCLLNKKLQEGGQFVYKAPSGPITFKYSYFNNSFSKFILIIPVGEKNSSRTVIKIRP